MPDNVADGPAPRDEDPAAPGGGDEESAQTVEDPGYLMTTGETAGEDGSVVPIIGGLPAAEGSAWDIGAPADERGAGLAEELGSSTEEDD